MIRVLTGQEDEWTATQEVVCCQCVFVSVHKDVNKYNFSQGIFNTV